MVRLESTYSGRCVTNQTIDSRHSNSSRHPHLSLKPATLGRAINVFFLPFFYSTILTLNPRAPFFPTKPGSPGAPLVTEKEN